MAMYFFVLPALILPKCLESATGPSFSDVAMAIYRLYTLVAPPETPDSEAIRRIGRSVSVQWVRAITGTARQAPDTGEYRRAMT